MVLPGPANYYAERALAFYLFGTREMPAWQPGTPLFAFDATRLDNGERWYLTKDFIGVRDPDVQMVGADGRPVDPASVQVRPVFDSPAMNVATAVAISAGFPPVLAPRRYDMRSPNLRAGSVAVRFDNVALADGGLSGNLGAEYCKFRPDSFVSDAVQVFAPEDLITNQWIEVGLRAADVVYFRAEQQNRSELASKGTRLASLGNLAMDQPLAALLAASMSRAGEGPGYDAALSASVPTRFASLPWCVRRHIVNWGYISAESATRNSTASGQAVFALPYPRDALLSEKFDPDIGCTGAR